MTNSETKNFSQNVSSSYHLEDRGKCNKNTCANARNIPKLRFKGYNDEWIEKTFDEIFQIIGNNTLSRDCLNYECMGTKNIHYGDILVKYNTCIDEDYCEIPIINSEISLDKIPMDNYLKQGDIVIADTAEDYTVGKTCEVINIHSKILSGLHTIPSRPKFHFAKGFLGYYFNSNKYHDRLIPLITGIKVSSINKKEIKKTIVKFPTLPEQEKIASFLTLIDKKIEKQKELVELLKKYKRGLLSAIFSQKMRFKDNNGNDYPAWEEKSLGEVTGNISYGLNAASKDYDGENKYIRITDIDETTGKYNNLDIVSPDCVLSDDYKLKINDLLFARTGASTGKTYLYNEDDGKIYFAGFLIKFSIKNEYCSNFIFYITQTFNYKKWVSIMSARSGQPGINSKEYSNYKFSCPVYDEQVKISNIISKLDNIIEKGNILLDFYNDYKKGLLQKMFI